MNRLELIEILSSSDEDEVLSLYDEGWHRIGCIGCPMSSVNQKKIENIRYPHVKRNWIKAIKAIRGVGAKFLPNYIWWNIRADWMPLRNVGGLLRTYAATSSIPTRNIGSSSILQTIRLDTKTETRGETVEYGLLQCTGFLPAPLLTA